MRGKRGGRRFTREAGAAYLMLLPDLAGLLLFLFIPILYAVIVSLNQWDGFTPMRFIGLGNYAALWRDARFWHAIGVTLRYVLLYVPAVFILSLLLALLVQGLRGKWQPALRTLFFLPYAISTVVASIVWVFLYDPRRGLLNQGLRALGLPAQRFLSAPTQALACVAAVGVWLVVGYNMVIFITALKDVPASYYEAADIDGAGTVRKFFSITFPCLRDTNIFILVVTTINSFQVFDQIKLMTAGGPGAATEVAVYYIFNQAFGVYNFGYSAAAALVLALIILLLTLVQLRVTGMAREEV